MICKKCKKDKPKTEYRYGHRTCKSCLREYSKEYAKKIREEQPWSVSYFGAKTRCNNPNDRNYKNYGGRGIKLLMTREDFKKLWFLNKAYKLKKPTIHRVNNDKNYEVTNCRFVEHIENTLNGRNPICVIKNCNRQTEGRGLCGRHYTQYWNWKDKDKKVEDLLSQLSALRGKVDKVKESIPEIYCDIPIDTVEVVAYREDKVGRILKMESGKDLAEYFEEGRNEV